MAIGIWGGPSVWPRVDEVRWMSPEQLVREGFRRSRVVMMNEARSGLRRCERTRRIGARILPMARACGATLLAMEALGTPEGPPPTGGALAQPDMVALLEQARLQGFELTGYDIDDTTTPVKLRTKIKSAAYTNWRNTQQAANLARLFSALPEDERMLVWCTNLHHATARFMGYRPMGWLFRGSAKVTPFSIDQTVTVDWTGQRARSLVLKWAANELTDRGGNAGFVWEEGLPRLSPGCDAFVLSLDNELT